MSLSSAKFAAVFDTLPADVKDVIVQKQLIPLLDSVSKGKRKKALASASKMQRRHAGIPTLDLRGKQREVNWLLDELHRDTKRSFVKERSHRSEILEQTVQSVTGWLSDIWRVVYEHNVDFMLAHRCLIYTVNTLEQIGHGRASCRCAFTSIYVPIVLKRRSGKVIRRWHVDGAHNVDEALLFIWRDLFLNMLASGNQKLIAKIPEMLDEMEDILGWTALEKLLYGGRSSLHDSGSDVDNDIIYDDSDLDEDEDDYTDDDSELDEPVGDHDRVLRIFEKPSPSHARHWSYRVSSQMWQFRKHVHTAMISVFKVNPSLRLYSALLASSTDPETTENELMRFLAQMGTSCPDAFAAALDIHAHRGNTLALAQLLTTHKHLVRPRDAPSLQAAAMALAADAFQQQRALELIESEMLDAARTTRAALSGPFSRLDAPDNIQEMELLLKMRSAAPGRQDRIERWVDAVSTPGTNNPNPAAIAAMVIGLPIMPVDGEDGDMLGYLDLDPNDPDLEDLRDEFRPKLKQRFEGWSDTAIQIKGGAPVLIKVYKEIVKWMPFLRASDVVEELASRLADRPSKQYVVDAVDALSAFVKVQRRKLTTTKNDQRRRLGMMPTQPEGSYIPPTPMPDAGVFNMIAEELDAMDDQPGTPPPLEPATPPTAPMPLFTFYQGTIAGPPPPAGPAAGPAGGGDAGPYGDVFVGFGGMEDID